MFINLSVCSSSDIFCLITTQTSRIFLVVFKEVCPGYNPVSVRVPSMGQIDLFKNYLYLIRSCAKKNQKTLQHQLHRKCKYECKMNAIL